MPITANDNGVLHTLGTVTTNGNGILRNNSTVSVNEGGVIKSVFAANKVKIEGITPLVVADDHIVIVDSGSGTISLPAGARIILGSRGDGQLGGYVAAYTLSSEVKNAPFKAQILNNTYMLGGGCTTIKIDGTTYICGNVRQIVQSKWGPIGGDGGCGEDDGDSACEASNGSGAGGGGGKHSGDICKGGNNGGYGNFGGNGGSYYNKKSIRSTDGSSGKGSEKSGSGGGGGYAAGGGGSACTSYNDDEAGTSATVYPTGDDGGHGMGIIVIEW